MRFPSTDRKFDSAPSSADGQGGEGLEVHYFVGARPRAGGQGRPARGRQCREHPDHRPPDAPFDPRSDIGGMAGVDHVFDGLHAGAVHPDDDRTSGGTLHRNLRFNWI